MSDVAIRVDGLGKQYRIGSRQEGYKTLRDTITDTLLGPARAVQGLVQRGGKQQSQDEILWALKDVSFEVKQGEVIGIIGRNGAGKSTLLKVLSRITRPTTGYADIHGRIGSLLEVGTGFHPELSGRENIFLNGAILGMRRADIESKFDEIVAFAEVEKFIDTPAKRYSSGMYLRLAFAVAAHLEPEILLVDEVLAVGDMVFQRKCLGKIGEVAQAGRTVLFVSHNMTAVSSLTNRCIALSGGQVSRDGETSDVIREYLASETTEGRVVWDDVRPGDDACELLMCQVGEDGTETEFSSASPIGVTIDFKVKQEVHGLRIGFDLVNHEGVLVFRAYHDDQVREPGTMQPGDYRVVCSIPPNLLNQGEYFLTLRAGIWAVRNICRLEQLIRFSIVNLTGSNSQYGHSRPGVLNPVLNWTTIAN